jgi:hypothetical protein
MASLLFVDGADGLWLLIPLLKKAANGVQVIAFFIFREIFSNQ